MPELIAPDLDADLHYLWEWFSELDMARTGSGFGMNLLPYSEIEAWSRMTSRVVSAWEVGVLKMMDALCVSTASRKKL